jgi:hypothetical protein
VPAASSARAGRTRFVWIAAAAAAIVAAIYVVPRLRWTTGAPETSPTFTQLTFRRGNLTEARFAPDGQTILYSAAWDGGPVQVFETRASGPHRVRRPAIDGPQACRRNELALIQNCQLMGFARDPRGDVAAGGAPRPLSTMW